MKLTKRDYSNGYKYVQLKISLADFEKLNEVANVEVLQTQQYAIKMLTDHVRKKYRDYVGSGKINVFKQETLFKKKGKAK